MRKKKGSLELSINAIVVLILAITLLGLGLGFIKTQFTKVTKQLSTVSGEMETLVREKIQNSGDLVAWMETRMDLTVGQPKDTYMGVRNTADSSKCFYVVFDCDSSVTQANGCTNMQVGNVGWDWFNTLTKQTLEGGETKVLPVKIQASTATPDTYVARVYVVKDDGVSVVKDDGVSGGRTACSETGATVAGKLATIRLGNEAGYSIHDKKEFTIDLK